MATAVQPSISSQQSIIIEDLLNDILDDVIATAVHRQLSAAGLAPAAGDSGAKSKAASAAGAPLAGATCKSSGGTASAAAELIAPHYSGGVVCVLDASIAQQQPLSAITLLKEGVDHNCDKCDAEFGLESLEAEGPAESWLVEADGATGSDPGRVFCKGPSWDRFVDKMKSAGGKDTDSCQQQQPSSNRTSSAGAIKEETPADTVEAAAAAAAAEKPAAALGSRSTSLAGKQQPGSAPVAALSRSNSSTAKRTSSLRTSAEMAPAGAELADTPATAAEQGNPMRRSSSRPLSSSTSSKGRPSSAEQQAAAAATGDVLRSSFEARRIERLSSGGGSRESDSWSKSLRSRAPASTYTDGGGSQRR
jgi:hypothetical protein